MMWVVFIIITIKYCREKQRETEEEEKQTQQKKTSIENVHIVKHGEIYINFYRSVYTNIYYCCYYCYYE